MQDDLIPGYRILKKLGHGAFAQVYLAVQRSLDREIALKVMNPSMASDKDLCERFIAEARVVASLRHRSIVSIHDVGKYEDNYYISMELIEGSTLATAILRKQFPAPVLTIIRQIAEALGCAHERGIVHRDVKPGNILLHSDSTAILTDFGIAKNLASDEQLTVVGSIIGTAAYMSPEQVSALEDIDGRSDIYSLGIVLYEMLTGSPPFRGKDHFTTALMHLNKAIPRLPDAHRQHQALLDRMLAKDRDERFRSAAEVVAFIDRVASSPHPASGEGAGQAGHQDVGRSTFDEGTILREAEPGTRRMPDVPQRPVSSNSAEPAATVMQDRRRSDREAREPEQRSSRSKRTSSLRWPLLGGAVLSLLGALAVLVFLGQGEPVAERDAPVGAGVSGNAIETDSGSDSGSNSGQSIERAPLPGSEPAPVPEPRNTPPPDAEMQWRIDNLLTAAQMHELVGRIMDPPGANAVEAYRDVLEIDPGNVQAREALQRLESQ